MGLESSYRLHRAALLLRQGGVIAYPTEAVFGLGCDPWDSHAVFRILQMKRRQLSKGLILVASDFDQLRPFVGLLPDARMTEILASWPGPNTWLFPAKASTPAWLTGRFDTIAVRVSAHPVAAGLCRAYGGAIVSTSANRATRPAARSSLGVRLALDLAPDLILGGDCGGSSRPSTIRDGRTGRLLRL